MRDSLGLAFWLLGTGGIAWAGAAATAWPPDAAVAKAEAGDVVLVRDGVYRDAAARLSGQGEAGKPIVIRAATPGGVILNGESPLVIVDSQHLVVDGFVFDQVWGQTVVRLERCRRVRITNCAFIESGSVKSTFPRIVEITGGSQYCRADHLFMRGNLSMGVGCPYGRDTPPDQVNSDNTFDHIWFKDIVRRRNNGQEAVFLGGGCTDTPHHATVEYNLFDNASGDAEAISNKSGYNILRFNTFRDSRAALVLRGGRNVRVEGNFFFNMRPGLRIYGTEHEIVHNHIQDCTIGIMAPTGTSYEVKYYNTFYQGLTNTRIANNTIVNCSPVAFQLGRGHGTEGRASKAWQQKRNWDGNTTYNKPPKANRFEKNLVVTDGGTFLERIAGEGNSWEGNVCVVRRGEGYDPEVARLAKVTMVEEGRVLRPVRGSEVGAGCDYSVVGGRFGRPLTPKDVGPEWMAGDPSRVRRVPDPKPPPTK